MERKYIRNSSQIDPAILEGSWWDRTKEVKRFDLINKLERRVKTLKDKIREERIAACRTPPMVSGGEEEKDENAAGPSKSPITNPDTNQEISNQDETNSISSIYSEREDPDNGSHMDALTALLRESAEKGTKKTTWHIEKSTSIEACHKKTEEIQKCEICGKNTNETATCFIARSYEVMRQG